MSSLIRRLASDLITIATSERGRARLKHRLSWSNSIKQESDKINHVTRSERRSRCVPVAAAETEASKASAGCHRRPIISELLAITVAASLIASAHLLQLASAYKSSAGIGIGGERMVRLCIASVDPIKLTSQCVMCNRREFPLTVIDCTGITKVNDLIANPLSVQEATCLIYNCRRQVPDVKPEPYHGSVSHAVNYRGAASNYHSSGMGGPVSGSNIYEMMTPSGIFGGGYPMYPSSGMQSQQSPVASPSPYMTRFGSNFAAASPYQTAYPPFSPSAPRGLIGGPSLGPDTHHALPYALVPAPRTFPFGKRLNSVQSVAEQQGPPGSH